MMSSKPPTYPGVYGTTSDLYPPSNFMVPGSQQPPGFINPRIQVQSSQAPFIVSPGILNNSQQVQGNIQMVNPGTGKAATNFKEEAKTLGAIQILIGSMHIGFGIILGLMAHVYMQVLGFTSFAFVSGYPFWGGLSFIITGILCILASKKSSPALIKSSLGMSIVSSIFAFIGMILLLVDESVNGLPEQDHWAVLSGKGISAMLIIFSLLEFCITCAIAYFASHAVTNTSGVLFLVWNENSKDLSTSVSSYMPLPHAGKGEGLEDWK